MHLEYARCSCSTEARTERREVVINFGSEPEPLRRVPAGVCRQCGRHVYKLSVLAQIESVAKGRVVDPRLCEPVV
jgi:hypothetical protein